MGNLDLPMGAPASKQVSKSGGVATAAGNQLTRS